MYLNMNVGDPDEKLTATIQPYNATNQNLSWFSFNSRVATVDEHGLVHAVSPGITLVKVYSYSMEDGFHFSLALVTVCASTKVSVTGVTLEPKSLDLVVGGANAALTATVNPTNATNKNVSWTSSDPSVATVDEHGIVHPVAPGTAVITVTTEDGGFTDTSTVNVTIPVIHVIGVTIEPKSLDLVVGGGNATLTATVNPTDATNKNVSWTSSDPNVATVDEHGVVHPVAPGTAVITVTTEDGGFTDTATVNVTNPVIHVIGVTLEPKSLDLVVGGDNSTLTATVNPTDATNKNVSWTSSDPSVATVDEHGVVHPVAPGTTVITVTTEDGGFTDTSTVNVSIPVIHVIGVTLEPKSLDLVVGGDNSTLTATVNPTDATNKNVSWTSSDPSVATVDEHGVVHPVAPGTAVITVTTEDGGFTDTATVNVVDPDTIAPVTRNSMVPIFDEIEHYIKGLTVTLTATDDKSGVKETMYRINGTTWTKYVSPFAIYADDTHTLEYYSTDNAGNIEKINFFDFDKGTCGCSK